MLFSESDLYFKLNGIFTKPAYLPCNILQALNNKSEVSGSV